MKDLYKVFYGQNDSEYQRIYRNRIEFPSTIKIDLSIKPINQANVFELYYIPTNDMINKISHIYKLSSELKRIFEKLPPIAKEQFIFERLVEELYHTNDLEGVKSTKAEIASSVREVNANKERHKRFHSMITSYQTLINQAISLPRTPQDIRKIYDNITKEEITEKELPDGDIFRKDITLVLKKSGSGKVIHRGITPESEIYTKIDQLLTVLNEQHAIPPMMKIAIGHYYFGYIHPFYDSNAPSRLQLKTA